MFSIFLFIFVQICNKSKDDKKVRSFPINKNIKY